MYKKLTSIIILLLAIFLCNAETLTPTQALERLDNDHKANLSGTRAISNPKLLMTLEDNSGEPAIYLFSQNNVSGLLVVSAESNTPILLGFSDKGTVDVKNLPPALEFWVKEYAREIGQLRQQSSPQQILTRADDKAPIAPLVSTKWDQGAPYNNLCPKVGSTSTWTGCVATSMAQVMNYFKYPEKGSGVITYTPSSLGKELTLDLSKITFAWSDMLNSYSGKYTTAQANAVAQLMEACGYSVNMNYGTDESGAISEIVPQALANNFDYDKSVLFYDRNWFSSSDWSDILYNNLKNVGPIIYSGTSQTGSGHSFVCDGYQGEGYFHFNWGWSGVGDGYYLIDALSPSSIGTGGGDGGFNYYQGAVLNIKPASGTSSSQVQRQFLMYGSLTGKVASNNLILSQTGSASLGWSYIGFGSVQFNIGVGFVKADDPNAKPVYAIADNIGTLELSAGYYYPQTNDFTPKIELSNVALETGVKYKAFVAAKRGNNWSEFEVPQGSFNYLYLTKTSDNTYEVTNLNVLHLTVTDLKFDSEIYADNSLKVSASLLNNNDIELTRAVSLVFLNENNALQFTSDSFVTTIQPGETQQFEWATPLVKNGNFDITQDTSLYPGIYDLESGSVYYKASSPVVMHPNPGAPVYSFEFIVENADKEGSFYVVEDPTDFNVISRVKVKSGYFSYPVTLAIFQVIPESNMASLILSFPYDIEFINAGETKDLVMNINFPNANVDDIYCIDAYVSNNGKLEIVEDPISTFFVLPGNKDLSSVGKVYGENADIEFDYDNFSKYLNIKGPQGIKSVTAFTADGKAVGINLNGSASNQTADLSNYQGSILIVTATDGQGRRKSVKLAL